MDGHTSESLAVLKNELIDKVQTMFYDYNRMREVVLQHTCEVDLEKRQMLDSIKNYENTDKIRLASIQCLEEDILKLQKTNHDYSEMIKSLEDKLVEKNKESESENKFSMIRIQANELGEKDREIERLNKVIFTLKQKKDKPVDKPEDKPDVSGWSPTSSNTPTPPVVELVLQETPKCIPDTLVVEEIPEKEAESETVTEEAEEAEEAEEEEADIFTYRKKEYYTIQGDPQQVVYELLEGDVKGKRLGTWTTTKKGNKKPVFDTS